MIKASGRIKLYLKGQPFRRNSKAVSKGSVLQVDMGFDIVRYYMWFVQRETGIILNPPRLGAHITIMDAKHHPHVDFKALKRLNGTKVEFEYDPYLIQGGNRKRGYINFYLKAYSDLIEEIKKEYGIVENERFLGTHITIGNSK